MKILFIADNFPPEYNAPATRTYEHCKEWVKSGADVTVITCFPNFPTGKIFEGYKNKLYKKENIDGIKVIRVWSFIAPNEGFFKRTLDFISFAFMAFIFGLFIKTDAIIATSPQFFSAISGRFLYLFKRKPWIMEVRDIWPESIVAVGAIKRGFILRRLEALEKHLYHSAKKIIVVTESFKEDIVAKGITGSKIDVVKNGANLELYIPKPKNPMLLKKYSFSKEDLIIGYIGTHGMAHNLEFIVRSIVDLNNPKIKFLFVGDGAEKKNILEVANQLGLKNIIFQDPISKSEIPDYLSIIDVSLVPLKKSNTFKNVIPSKIFESSAMGKPVLLGVEGESKKLVEDYNAGLTFEPENKEDLLQKVNEFALLNGQIEDYQKGAKKLAKDFDRKMLAEKMLDSIKKVIKKK